MTFVSLKNQVKRNEKQEKISSRFFKKSEEFMTFCKESVHQNRVGLLIDTNSYVFICWRMMTSSCFKDVNYIKFF